MAYSPYIPDDIKNKAEGPANFTLGSLAKNMVVGAVAYGASTSIINLASRSLVKYLGPAVAKGGKVAMTKLSKNVAKTSQGGIVSGIAKKIGLTFGDDVAPSIGELVGRKFRSKANAGTFGAGMRDFIKYEKHFTKKAYSTPDKFMKTMNQYITQPKSSSTQLQRFASGTSVRAARIATEMPGMYAIDRLFGDLYGWDNSGKAPLTDIPATIKDFAEYGKTMAPGFMLFRTASIGAKYLKFKGSRFVKNTGIDQIIREPTARAYSKAKMHMKASSALFRDTVTPKMGHLGKKVMQDRMNYGLARGAVKGLAATFRDTKEAYTDLAKGLFSPKKYGKFVAREKERNRNEITKNIQTRMLDFTERIEKSVKGPKEQASALEKLVRGYNEINIRDRSNRSSWTSYFMNERFEKNKQNFNMKVNVVDDVFDRAKEFGNLASKTTGKQKTAFEIKQQSWKNLAEVMQKSKGKYNVNINNVMSVDGYHTDLNKLSLRGGMESVVKSLSRVKLRIPKSAVGYLVGKPMKDIEFPVFKMMGIADMLNRTPAMTLVDKGEKIKWLSIDKTDPNKHIPSWHKNVDLMGGYIHGKPFEFVKQNGSLQMKWAPHRQRYKDISGTIVEKAAEKITNQTQYKKAKINAFVKSHSNINQRYSYTANNRSIDMISKERGISRKQAQHVLRDKVKEGTYNINDSLTTRDKFMRNVETKVNNFKYRFELGEYGSGDQSVLKNISGRFTKFFDKRSNYRFFRKRGGMDETLSAIEDFTSRDLSDIAKDPVSLIDAMDDINRLDLKARTTASTQSRRALHEIDMDDISKYLKDKKDGNYDLIHDPDRMQKYLKKQVKENYNNHIFTDADRNILDESLDVANKGDIHDSLYMSDLSAHKHYTNNTSNMEIMQKATLLGKEAENIQMLSSKNATRKIYDIQNTMLGDIWESVTQNKKYQYTEKMIGSKNPFKLRMQVERIHQKYGKFGEYFDIKTIRDKNPEQVVEHFRKMGSQFNKMVKKDLPKFYNDYRYIQDDLVEASKRVHGLLDSRHFKSGIVNKEIMKNSAMSNMYGGHSLMLSSIKQGKDFTMPMRKGISDQSPSNLYGYFMTERLNRVASLVGLAVDAQQHATPSGMMKAWGMKKMLPIMGIGVGYTVLDQVTDIADVGPFDEGLTVFGAEKIIEAQDITSRMRDMLGITSASKNLEGLMPGFINSPGAKFLRTGGYAFGGAFIGTALGNPAAGAAVGLAASAFQDFGLSDLTNTVDENREIWSGRKKVPIRSSARWTLSKGFYGGDKISGWEPHWFARVKAQPEYSDVLYGSKAEALVYKPLPFLGFNPIGYLLDPYHYEKLTAEERPYPYTGGIGSEMPFIGPIVDATAGRIMKPTKILTDPSGRMKGGPKPHQSFIAEQQRLQTFAQSAIAGGAYTEDALGEGIAGTVASPRSAQGTMHQFVNRGVYEPLGLFGWAAQSMSRGTFGKDTPFQPDKMAESADRMTSMGRAYWDENLGDMLLINEFTRRMLPKEKGGYNPLKNNMAHWLPDEHNFIDFHTGDAFSKIPHGESRLPGEGLEKFNDINITFPTGASSAGYDPMSMAMNMTGLRVDMDEALEETTIMGEKIHQQIQDSMIASGMAKETERVIYDPMTAMKGRVDLTGRNGEIIEVKTVESVTDLENLRYPKRKHKAQINIYMNALNQRRGRFIYVAREDPTQMKTFDVGFDPRQYFETVKNVTKARQMASSMPRDIMAPGAGYSHLDRMNVLCDIAPFSKEYQESLSIVEQMDDMGMLSEREYFKYYESKKMADAQMRPTDVYPNRFWGNLKDSKPVYDLTAENLASKSKARSLMRGEITSLDRSVIEKGLDSEYNMFNLNSTIKDAAEYDPGSRLIGAAWEGLLKVQVPYASRKFMQYWTPMEAYKRNVLQGSKDSYWDTPKESFIEPMFDQAFASTNPIQGAMSGMLMGTMAGGTVGTMLGLGAGMAYGTGRGIYEMAGGSPYIKEDVKRARNVESMFYDMEIQSARAEYESTGNLQALQILQRATDTSLEGSKYQVSEGLPKAERSYVSMMMASGKTEQLNELMNYMPEKNREVVDQIANEYINMDKAINKFESTEAVLDWNIINDDDIMDKMKYRVLKDEGVNTYLSGLGWKNQLAKFNGHQPISDLRNPALNRENMNTSTEMEVRNVIYNILKETGAVGMINIQQDRSGIIEVVIT